MPTAPSKLRHRLALFCALAACNDPSPTGQSARDGHGGPTRPTPPPLPEFPHDGIEPATSVGYLTGSGGVSANGQATYRIPIDVPPGRVGLAPSLALAYSSGGGDGIAGVGWGLTGLSEIRRCPRVLDVDGVADAMNWDATDAFCLDGQKLVQVSFDFAIGARIYRTERDAYAKIAGFVPNGDATKPPEAFTVWSRDGRITEYEPLAAKRTTVDLLDPTVHTEKLVDALWVERRVRDRSGNRMDFTYDTVFDTQPPYAMHYFPETIRYTAFDGPPAESASRFVRFEYEDRIGFDSSFAYEGGVRYSLAKRLRSIEVYAPPVPAAPPVLAWHYDLTYKLSDSTFRSLLSSVRMVDAAGGHLWAKELAWNTEEDPGDLTAVPLVSTVIQPDVQGGPIGCGAGPGDTRMLVLDANGDGKDDLLYWDDPTCDEYAGPWESGIIGDIVFHLELRLSGSGALNGPVYEVGEARKAYCEPQNEANCNNQFRGLRLAGSRAIDIDGDGRSELLAEDRQGGARTFTVLRWNDVTHALEPVSAPEPARSVEVVDLEGDGLPDLVESVNDTWYVRTNLGPPTFGFGPKVSTGVADTSASCVRGLRAGDFDGDGRGDLLVPGPAASCAQQILIRRDDIGVLTATATSLDTYNFMVLADINGDGLRDVLHAFADADPATIRWNTGRGHTAPTAVVNGPTGADDARVLDLNGDGRDDLFTTAPDDTNPLLHDEWVYLAMGGEGQPTFFRYQVADDVAAAGLDSGDFDGDGMAEIVELVGNSGAPALVVRDFPIATDLDRVVAIRDEGAGHPRETFSYARAWSDTPQPQACVYPVRCVRHGITVVREHGVAQGEALAPTLRTTRYAYDGPVFDLRGRGFLGFSQTVELELGTYRQRTTTYDAQSRVPLNGGAVYARVGQPTSIVEITPLLEQPQTTPPVAPPAGAVRARIDRRDVTYEVKQPTFASYDTVVSRWTTSESEADVILGQAVTISGPETSLRGRTGSRSWDDYGNLLVDQSTTVGGVTRTIATTYQNQGATWLVGLPLRIEAVTTDAAHPQVSPRVIAHVYDALGRIQSTTVEPDHPNTPLWGHTTVGYDMRGLVDHETSFATGEAPRTTWRFYDDEGVYLRQVQNAGGQWTAMLRDPARGVPLLTVDVNGVVNAYTYDTFGRLLHAHAPLDAGQHPLDLDVETSYAAFDNGADHAGVEILSTSNDGTQQLRTRIDELGREVQRSHRGFDGLWVTSFTQYNLFGSATWVSRPGSQAHGVTTTYDGLGRAVRIETPDGNHTIVEPAAFSTKTTAPDGAVTLEQRDVDDRVVATTRYAGGGQVHPVVTSFTYGPFDELATVTDDDGHVAELHYDGRGRRVYHADPDRGFSITNYNGFDEVVSEIDSLLFPTTYVRDALGRTTSVTDSDGTRTFAWDTAPHGIGRLAATTSPDDVAVAYTYDELGRFAGAQWTLDASTPKAETFAMEATYDPYGRVDEIRYPQVPGRARFVVRAHYNVAGYLDRRDDVSDPASPIELWRIDAREADEELARASVGGVVTELVHDPIDGRLIKLWRHLEGSTTALEETAYTYEPDGDLASRHDVVHDRKETFSYDGLDRLRTWKLSSPATAAFPTRETAYDYDDLGNLEGVQIDGVIVSTASFGWGGKPHACTIMDGGAFAYDPRGRQVDGPARTAAFTAFDLPKKITPKSSNPAPTYFTYDASQTRIRTIGPDTTTVHIGGVYERRTRGPQITHVFTAANEVGAVQVTYDEASTKEQRRIAEADPQGSVQVVRDAAGAVVERRYLEPFGGRTTVGGIPIATPASPVTRGFTGHTEDADLGLIDMRGRSYDPRQRRFLTPDPLVGDPRAGQTLNRYAYVVGNPLRYTDPSGFQPIAPGTAYLDVKDGEHRLVAFTEDVIIGQRPAAPASPTASDAAGSTPAEGATAGTKAEGEVPPPPPPPPPPPTPGTTPRDFDLGLRLYDESTKHLKAEAAESNYSPNWREHREPTILYAAVPPPGPLTRAFAIGSAIAADGIGTGVAGTTVAILSRFGQRIGVKVSESAPALLAEAPAIAEEVAAAKTLFDANLGDIAPKLVTPRFLDLAANPNLTRVVYGRALELWVNLATTLGRQGTYLAGANQPDWTITLQGQLVRIDLTTFQALGPHLARGMYQANQPFMIFMYEVPAL